MNVTSSEISPTAGSSSSWSLPSPPLPSSRSSPPCRPPCPPPRSSESSVVPVVRVGPVVRVVPVVGLLPVGGVLGGPAGRGPAVGAGAGLVRGCRTGPPSTARSPSLAATVRPRSSSTCTGWSSSSGQSSLSPPMPAASWEATRGRRTPPGCPPGRPGWPAARGPGRSRRRAGRRPRRGRGERGPGPDGGEGPPPDHRASSRYPAPRTVRMRPGAQLAAQGADVHLDDVGVAVVGEVPDVVEDLATWRRPRRRAAPGVQDRELLGGQRDLDALAAARAGRGVDRRPPDRAAATGRARSAAAQQGPQPGDQDDVGERLGQVVVGAGVQRPRPRRTRRPWR